MQVAEGEIRTVTLKLLAEIAETDARAIQGTQKLREDLGMDSLQSLELLSSVGEALRIELDVEQAMHIRTVEDACSFVVRQYDEHKPHAVAG